MICLSNPLKRSFIVSVFQTLGFRKRAQSNWGLKSWRIDWSSVNNLVSALDILRNSLEITFLIETVFLAVDVEKHLKDASSEFDLPRAIKGLIEIPIFISTFYRSNFKLKCEVMLKKKKTLNVNILKVDYLYIGQCYEFRWSFQSFSLPCCEATARGRIINVRLYSTQYSLTS